MKITLCDCFTFVFLTVWIARDSDILIPVSLRRHSIKIPEVGIHLLISTLQLFIVALYSPFMTKIAS